MLAAAPSYQGRSLDLFVLALTLAGADSSVSEDLKSHFNRVLVQARAVLDNPRQLAQGISPEAVKLALELASDGEMRAALEGVQDFSSVTPSVARRVLADMGERVEA